MTLIDGLKESLTGVFPEESEEFKSVIEAYSLVAHNSPTIASEAKTAMLLLDNSKVKLTSIYFMLGRAIGKLKAEMQTTYDSSYTRLVKLGRPSNASIEAEIRVQNPGLAGIMKQCSDYEEVRSLLLGYIKCLDSAKATAIEVLRDSRRVD